MSVTLGYKGILFVVVCDILIHDILRAIAKTRVREGHLVFRGDLRQRLE